MSLHGNVPGSEDAELFSTVVTGEEGRLRGGYQAADAFRPFLEGIRSAPGASGFFNYEQIRQDVDEETEIVAIDEGDGCVRPSARAIQAGRYSALARPVYMYASEPAMKRHRPVRSFVRYAVEDYRQQILVTPSLVPVSDSVLRRAARKLPEAPVPAG